MSDIAYINSVETLGTLDGPGLRTVIFFQGCGLRCKFCHNPECFEMNKGKIMTLDHLFNLVVANKPYLGNSTDNEIKGGVTYSGGEPLLQTEFIATLSKKLKKEGIHQAVDSSLFVSSKNITLLLPLIDYWMVSIKHMDTLTHKDLTGYGNEKILKNIKFLDSEITRLELPAKIRVRYLILPGITDTSENIKSMSEFISTLVNIDCVELLGYGSHAKAKWIKLFGHYDLDTVADASEKDILKVASIMEAENIKVIY